MNVSLSRCFVFILQTANAKVFSLEGQLEALLRELALKKTEHTNDLRNIKEQLQDARAAQLATTKKLHAASFELKRASDREHELKQRLKSRNRELERAKMRAQRANEASRKPAPTTVRA